MNPVIAFSNVAFSYQNTPILKNVSFQVNEGECIGVIGPNGGGKTTLLKLILGFLKPSHGSIKTLALSDIAYVPQSLHFDKQFPISVFEVVLSGRLSNLNWLGGYPKKDKEIALQKLEQVGLAKFAHAPFGTLSGGQMQRVLIARALASEPKLLLLDEPTASVDTQAEADIFKLLKSLQGITLIIVTHDLNQAINQVDRLLCVQCEVIPLTLKEVCEHFALGLYHTPLIQGHQPVVQLKRPL